jgi:hypothetical protein
MLAAEPQRRPAMQTAAMAPYFVTPCHRSGFE